MSCAFCGMPPRDGEPCCTGRFKVETMRRADRTIATQKLELARTAALLAECEEALEKARHFAADASLLHPDVSGPEAAQFRMFYEQGSMLYKLTKAILSKIRSEKEKA